MKRTILILSCLGFFMISCASQEGFVDGPNRSGDFVCGSHYTRKHPVREQERTYRQVSSIGLDLVIKDNDTLDINELICVDSLKFTQELNQFQVREMCVEMGIQGKTYFTAKTNKYGGFEEVNVVRSVDHCFKDVEEKIKQKALTMRIIPEQAGTYEIVFYHLLLLD